MRQFPIILSFLSVLLFGNLLYAQPGGLPTEQVEIIKSFDARLADAVKVNVPPAKGTTDTSAVKLNYNIEAKSSSLSYDPPKLRPLALRREPAPEQYKGFVKAGYGLPSSPFFQAGYYLQNEDRFDAHIKAYHHSAESKKIENQRFGRSGFGIDGNYHFPQQFSVHGDIGFQQELVSFYGYDHADTTFSKGATKQRFNRFHLGTAAYNTRSNRLGIDYRADLKYYGLRDFFDASENGLDLELSVIKWFADSHPLRIIIGNDWSAFRDTIDKSLNTFYVRPSFTFHGNAFRLRVGVNLLGQSKKFHLLPDLEAMVSLAGNAFAIYAGWKGDYHQNSLDNLSRYNPFMVSEFDPRSSIYQDIYGGVKGAASGWNYQGQIGFKRVNNLALFLPDSADTRRFAILYDTVNIVYISGGAGIELWPGFEVSGTVIQNFYSPENEKKAWHLPGLEMNGSVRYLLLNNKLLLRGDLYLADGVPYQVQTDESKRLGGLLDISMSGHYQIIRNLGAWLQVNNLTNNQRERWQRYPSFGTNVLAGLQMRF